MSLDVITWVLVAVRLHRSAALFLVCIFAPPLSHQFEILLPRNSGSGVGPEHAMYLPCLGVRSARATSPRNQQPIAVRICITPAFQAAATVVHDHHYRRPPNSHPPKHRLAGLAPTHRLRMGSAP